MRKKYKLSELAQKHNISVERVRQILNPEEQKYCVIHQRKFPKKGACSLCYILEYYPKVLASEHLDEEIRLLKEQDRKIEAVYMRSLLVKYLVNEKKLSFSDIGRLLERDYSSISNLYNKQL